MLRLGMTLPWSHGRIQVANEIDEVLDTTPEGEPEWVQSELPLIDTLDDLPEDPLTIEVEIDRTDVVDG
jgi:hypothetical protein